MIFDSHENQYLKKVDRKCADSFIDKAALNEDANCFLVKVCKKMWIFVSMLVIFCGGVLAIPPQHIENFEYEVIKFGEGLELIGDAFYAGEQINKIKKQHLTLINYFFIECKCWTADKAKHEPPRKVRSLLIQNLICRKIYHLVDFCLLPTD